MYQNTCRSVKQIFEDATFNKRDRTVLKFDNNKLNLFFENGILNYSLIELIGNAGSGKTQFALTVCAEQLIKIYKENKQDVIFYVYMKGSFPIKNLTTIIQHKLKHYNDNNDSNSNSNNHINEQHSLFGCVLKNFVNNESNNNKLSNNEKLSNNNKLSNNVWINSTERDINKTETTAFSNRYESQTYDNNNTSISSSSHNPNSFYLNPNSEQ
ncbi:bromodomain-containing protein DDB_G0280777-like, partial [Piliocolobus tephrosceles]|uniref:bromodomain-containing protein DDB_G0280777-like n=1 Tax=Piliocolobus tephrosceles TaxID=591936 RepID=UPI000C2B511B